MPQIVVEDLVKTFRVAERAPGLWGAVRGLVRRRHRTCARSTGCRSRSRPASWSATSARTAPASRPPSRCWPASSCPTAAAARCWAACRGRSASRTSRASASCSASARSCGGTCRSSNRSSCCATSTGCRRTGYVATRDELIALLDLEPLLDVPVRQLSLGQRMRCDLAAALLHAPPILFLDEPTIGLDAVSKLAVRDFVTRLNRERGVTVILTTHDMDDIEALCTRVIVIGDGQILSDGTLSELRARVSRERWLTVDLVHPDERGAGPRRHGHPARRSARVPGVRSAARVARRADPARDQRPRDARSVRREPADRDDRRAAVRRIAPTSTASPAAAT